MVSPQGDESRVRSIVGRITSARAGSDDFGARSCVAFAISLVLLWLLIVKAPGDNGWSPLIPMVVLSLGICGANLLGVVFAIFGIGRALRERRVPICSILGIILNVAPSGVLLAILLFRA